MPGGTGKLLRTGVQGKYAERFREGTHLVLLAPDVADAFPTATHQTGHMVQIVSLSYPENGS